MKHFSLPTLILALTLMVTGCDLQTEPWQSISPDVALGTLDGVESTLTSAYYRMQRPGRYGRHLLLAPEILADNAVLHPQPSGRYSGQATNNPGSHIGGWGNNYNTINEANLVIEGVDEVEGAQARKDRLKGEGLWMRAFSHFDLARVYGYEPGQEVDGWDLAVPLRTSATRDASDADFRPRSTNREVYDQVVADLEEALTLLQGNDRGVHFANYAATHALLARVHLYQANWEDAIHHADEAIANGPDLVDEGSFASPPADPMNPDEFLTQLSNVDNIFSTEPNPESIFELSYHPQNESVGSNQAPVAILTPQTWYDLLPTQSLLDLYQEGDVRNMLYTTYVDPNYGGADDHPPMVLKYTQSVGVTTDYHPVIRVPEMYLIKAEAYAELGDEDAALDNLHELQEARGMDPADVSGYDAIIQEVMDERRRELAFEGHRFFDLKRKGWDIPKPDGSVVPYEAYYILDDIPDNQVSNNPEMVQNPGY